MQKQYKDLIFAYNNEGYDEKGGGMGQGKYSVNTRRLVHRGAYRQLGPVGRVILPCSIMSIELFERMAYYSIVNFILYYLVKNLEYNAKTSALFLLGGFSGAAYLTAPIGGFIADKFLGRFFTIMASAIVYIAGLTVLVMASFDSSLLNIDEFDLNTRNSMAVAGLVLIVVGGGGIKANVPPFGADQIRPLGDEAVTSYFHWYYFFINIGSVVAFLGVYHLQTYDFIGTGLLVPLCGMAASLLVFAAMYSQYVKYKPEGETGMGACSIMREGCCKSTPDANNKLPAGSENAMFARAMESFGGTQPDHIVYGFTSALKTMVFAVLFILLWFGVSVFFVTTPFQSERMDRSVASSEIPFWVTKSFQHLAILIAVPSIVFETLPLLRYIHVEVSSLKRIGVGTILVLLGLIVSGIVEISRKNTMEDGGFEVETYPISPAFKNYLKTPEAQMEIEDFVERKVAGILEQQLRNTSDQLASIPSECVLESNLTDAGISPPNNTNGSPAAETNNPGMEKCISKLGMMGAQSVALDLAIDTPDGFPLWELKQSLNVSHTSVLTQIPQFILMGAGEALAAAGGLELAYNQSPFAYQGILTGCFVMAMGVGSLLTSGLSLLIDSATEECNAKGLCSGTWFSTTADINDTNMEYFLFVAAGIVAFQFIVFIIIAICYRYSDPMSFGELEEPELPGIEMKVEASRGLDLSSNGNNVPY
ncbi:solute carrier family 15 member 4 [Plakobranchus ocellatus]|uniref:Solute carrier family 15 member 4 n=1 Tax=Plakobranchus ocellatus TaxID=259542 RepID=A0AAV3Y7N7_9GAST|nr:solute carrier family 15 member 4 [Plakobranchus ocellatus]